MIEIALYKHLQEQFVLEPYLATYNGRMAIFNQEVPSDTDEGWEEEKSQYGRIVYALDLSDDPERKYSGTLTVDVQCEKDVQEPEVLEPIVRELIDGYFFSTEEITIAAQWSTSNYFTEPTEEIIGVTLTYGLLAFPKQTTIEPDPIALINKWTQKELQEITGIPFRIIGYDVLKNTAWKPTNDTPAIYWRMSNIGPCGWIPDTYHCSWHTATVHGHIMAADKDVNATIARAIDNILTMKRRLIFEDMSPLMVDRNIRVNLGNDQMRVGQITLDATYGILRCYPHNPLNHLSVNGKEVQ